MLRREDSGPDRPTSAVGLVSGAGLILVVAIFGAIVAGDHGPTSFDRWAFSLLQHLPEGTWSGVSKISSPELLGTTVVLCAAYAYILRRSWRLALTCLTAPAIALLLDTLAKSAFGRLYDGVLSYPSGNVAAVTAVVGVAVLVLPRRHRAIFVGAGAVPVVLIAIAVVNLRWHYATDAIAGAILGIAVVLIVNDFMQFIPAIPAQANIAESSSSDEQGSPPSNPPSTHPTSSFPLWAAGSDVPGPEIWVHKTPSAHTQTRIDEPVPVPVAVAEDDLVPLPVAVAEDELAVVPVAVTEDDLVPLPVAVAEDELAVVPVAVAEEDLSPLPVAVSEAQRVFVVDELAVEELTRVGAGIATLIDDLDAQLDGVRTLAEHQVSSTRRKAPVGPESEGFVLESQDYVDQVVAGARRQASEVVAAARAEAREMITQARIEARAMLERKSGEWLTDQTALKELEDTIERFSRANNEVTRDLLARAS